MIPVDWSAVDPEGVGLSSSHLDAVDTALQEFVDRRVLAGAATLIARHGMVARSSFIGVDDPRTGKRLADDTIYRIFSMTKPVVAVAMGILADRGFWHADDPLSKHLPELAGLSVMEELPGGGTVLRPPHHPPTMGELMTHTAGFSYGNDMAEPVDALYKQQNLFTSATSGEFVERLAGLPLAYQPGTKWKYSVSVDVQGAIIERLTGLSLSAFLRDEIFVPLGMHDTGFFVAPEKTSRLAALHYSDGSSQLNRLDHNPFFPESDHEPEFALGGAGLTATIWDYARFARMLLSRGTAPDGRRIVSDEAIAAQTTNHLPAELIAEGFHTGHMRFRPGFGYGYNGVVVHNPQEAHLPVGRGTYFWDGLAGTWFWIDPENDLIFVGMVQMASHTAPPLQEITQKLVAAAIMTEGTR